MTEQTDRFNDPKTQLLQWIVEQDKLLTGYMLSHDEAKAAHVEALLIRQVDPDAVKAMAADMRQLVKELTLNNYDTLSDNDVCVAYEFIHRFLIKSYYKGWGGVATPKESRPVGRL